jgi:hypothetical protein
MMVDVNSDDVEADLARVELLGGAASPVALFDRIAVMLVSYRWRPTVNYGRSVSSPSKKQREAPGPIQLVRIGADRVMPDMQGVRHLFRKGFLRKLW